MKLFLNYSGSNTGSGKIKFTDIHELLMLEDALKHYREHLINKPGEKSEKFLKKIDNVERLINELQLENAEKTGKKYDSSIGISLNHFLITIRHKSKVPLIELADHLHITPSQYSAIEKEKCEAAPEVLMDIFEYLKVFENIKIKLHEYLPAIEYFYNGMKIHEVFFENRDGYDHYVKVILGKFPEGCIESISAKAGL
ncbi:MAG: helix-turn-helix domain-containing protein [Clostridiaceae bacterium]